MPARFACADRGRGVRETESTLGAYRPQVEGNRRRRRHSRCLCIGPATIVTGGVKSYAVLSMLAGQLGCFIPSLTGRTFQPVSKSKNLERRPPIAKSPNGCLPKWRLFLDRRKR